MPTPGDGGLPIVGIPDTTQFSDFTLHNSKVLNLRMCPTGSEETAYYVNNTELTAGAAPDVTLYRGTDKNAPIVGVSRLTLSGSNTVGLGEYSKADVNNVMVWERLERTSKWSHANYEYEFSFGGGLGTRTKFEWRRVKRVPITGTYYLQLVELSNPDVVLGAFVPGPGMRVSIRGRLLVKKGYGEDWEKMALLTGLSLIELTRRRLRRRHFQ
jgi:hypothetical protein